MSERPENCFTMLGTDYCVFEEADVECAREEVRDAYQKLTKIGDLLTTGNVAAALALVLEARKACTFAHEALDGEMLMPRPLDAKVEMLRAV